MILQNVSGRVLLLLIMVIWGIAFIVTPTSEGFGMYKTTNILWTRLLPDDPVKLDRQEWIQHGGKWIIFDRKDRIMALSEKLVPLIDSGEIQSAKYWNKDPSAICVYSLDRDREKVWDILRKLGAGDTKVWEYDYATGKNLQNPVTFLYSWFSKFRTIIQSYGVAGTIQLINELLKSEEDESHTKNRGNADTG